MLIRTYVVLYTILLLICISKSINSIPVSLSINNYIRIMSLETLSEILYILPLENMITS